MNPYKMFSTDAKAETEVGVIIDYDSFRVRVARAGGANKKFNRLIEKRLEPYERQMKAKIMSEEVATRVMVDTYVDTVILGFEVKEENGEKVVNYIPGIPAKDGSVLPFTKANLTQLLLDLPELFKDIQSQATSIALFRSEEVEEEAKN